MRQPRAATGAVKQGSDPSHSLPKGHEVPCGPAPQPPSHRRAFACAVPPAQIVPHSPQGPHLSVLQVQVQTSSPQRPIGLPDQSCLISSLSSSLELLEFLIRTYLWVHCCPLPPSAVGAWGRRAEPQPAARLRDCGNPERVLLRQSAQPTPGPQILALSLPAACSVFGAAVGGQKALLHSPCTGPSHETLHHNPRTSSSRLQAQTAPNSGHLDSQHGRESKVTRDSVPVFLLFAHCGRSSP